jgi:hypothetical protein
MYALLSVRWKECWCASRTELLRCLLRRRRWQSWLSTCWYVLLDRVDFGTGGDGAACVKRSGVV